MVSSLEPAAPLARRALIGSGVLLAVAVGIANGLNAVFQLALARILEPSEFSLLAALFTAVLIAAVPPLAFQATVARAVAVHLADGDAAAAARVLGGTLAGVGLLAAALLVLAAVAAGLVAGTAGGAASLDTAGTAATATVALAIPVAWGGLQGAGRFVELAGAHVLFAGSRLAAGIGIGLAGGGAGAVMAGVAGATAVTVVLSLVPLRRLLAAPGREARRIVTRANAGAALGLTALTALSATDLLVAKLAFPAERAGAYAAASIGARVLLLVPIAVTTVLFPRVATLRDARRERRHLLAGAAVVAGAGAALTAVLWGLAGPLLEIAFGPDYTDAEPWLGPLALAMTVYAVATVYLYHFLSLGRQRFAVVLLGLLAVQLAAFAGFHGEPAELIGVQLGVAASTLAAAELWHRLRHDPRPG